MIIHSLPDNLQKLNQSTSISEGKIYNFTSLRILSLNINVSIVLQEELGSVHWFMNTYLILLLDVSDKLTIHIIL